jgi:hypothetical protein
MKMLYKYRADSKYTEMIFTTGKVHLSTATALNDPFECTLQKIGEDWISQKVSEMQLAGVFGFLTAARRATTDKLGFFGLSEGDIQNVIREISAIKDMNEAYNYYRDFMIRANGHPPSDCDNLFSNLDQQLNDVGIFSMSARTDHPLLWAHYAGDQRWPGLFGQLKAVFK